MSTPLTRRELVRRAGVLGVGAAAGPSVVARSASAATPEAAGQQFRVGVITSLSGDDALGGKLTKRGYDFWAETMNRQGGIPVAGKRYGVKMIYADDKSDPATGADAAERLITQEHVDVLFGPYTSGVQLAVNPIAIKYRVPVIAGSAESPGIWDKHPQFAFGIIPSVDLTAGKALGTLVRTARPRPRTAAVLGANEPFSKDAAAGFATGAKEAGLTIVKNELFPPDADMTPLVSSIATKKPDIVAVGGHESNLIDLVKAAKSLNFAPKAIIMHYGVTEPAFAQALHADADGVFGLVDWTPDSKNRDRLFGTAAQYARAYLRRYRVEPDYTGAACTASGEVFAAAAAKLGKAPGYSSDDRAKLNSLIERTSLQSFYGLIRFETSGDHYHDNTAARPVLVQIQKGRVVAVGPGSGHKAPMIYPLRPWGSR